jgi:hypothetical protein
MDIQSLTDDKLAYFALFNWANKNRPDVFPPGGYVYAISSTRESFLKELAEIGKDSFIKKHDIETIFKPKSKGRNMAWTDEKKALVVKMYEDANPTPETSIEIVKQIAEDVEETPNGVRMILSKADVYVKKEAGATTGTAKASTGGTRVSKSDSIQSLKDVISSAGLAVDDDVLDKLTGKQAVYLTDIVKNLIK